VLTTFADGFGEAYKPLLTEMQQAFDASIQQGLQDAVENGTLRQQLLKAGRQQAAAEDAVTVEVISGRWGHLTIWGHPSIDPAVKQCRCLCTTCTPPHYISSAPMPYQCALVVVLTLVCPMIAPVGREQQRQDLHNAIAAAQKRLDAAHRRRDLATRDLARAKAELERLSSSAKASKAAKQRLADAATAEANWLAARPQAATLLALTAGPLTHQVRCLQPSTFDTFAPITHAKSSNLAVTGPHVPVTAALIATAAPEHASVSFAVVV
jgi:hypothetical protein